MATIRKTNTQKWEVQIRRKGVKAISKTFHRKSDALEWSRLMEHQADRRSPPKDVQQLDRITLAELIDRYIDEVLPHKKGCQVETTVLKAFKRHQVARLKLSELSPAHFSSYRDERIFLNQVT